jgi:Ca2+-binding EF-hand superfamily protein
MGSRIVAPILFGIAVVSTSALAAEPAPARQPALLAAADLDQDGRVTVEELRADRERQVARFDVDQDGKLSAAEYEAWWLSTARPRLERLFRADDRNGDGSIALDELVARANDMLRRRDRDGDGALTAEELRPRRRSAASAAPASGVTNPIRPTASSS